MFRFRIFRPVVVAGLLLILTAACAVAIPDFTFLHGSDSHSPENSGPAIAEVATMGAIPMSPFGVTAQTPSFVIMSGDLMEFGPFEGAMDKYLGWWKDVKIPVYHQSGNHDGTWYNIRRALRRWYGSHCYSFDKNGCHFIGLDTSGLQDPRPGITREQLLWLKDDLAKVGKSVPVFVFFHHPLPGTEFASEYDYDRLFDILHPYNVVLLMAGHSHGHVYKAVDGFDQVTGGSTFGKDPGFSVISVKDNTLRVAYKKAGESNASIRLLQKPLTTRSSYPTISITPAIDGTTLKTGSTDIIAAISGNSMPITVVGLSIDGRDQGDPLLELGKYRGTIDTSQLTPGAHNLKIRFTDEGGKNYQKVAYFYVESPQTRSVWRAMAGGSCKGTPALTSDTVYVGATDSKLYALKRTDGSVRWTYKAGGEILCQPLVIGNTIYFGSGDAKFYAVGTDGKRKWVFEAGGPVYSSPVSWGDLVVFGCNDGKLYALNAVTGKPAWTNADAKYTIEVKPFVDGDTIYFGAWDTYVYAVDARSGQLKWKCVGKGSATQPAARYYSPADCGPVASGGKVFVADRHMDLSIIDAASGQIVDSRENCSGVGLSQDGQSVYLRGSNGDLTKVGLDGSTIWSVDADLGAIPTAPTERDGVVYVCTGTGLVEAFSAADGKLLWNYQATPKLFVMSSVEAGSGIAFVTGMDGSITAVKGTPAGGEQ